MHRCQVTDVVSGVGASVMQSQSTILRNRARSLVRNHARQHHVRYQKYRTLITQVLSVDDVLHSMRTAHPSSAPCLYQTHIRGTGEHLGISATWNMLFRPDGAFHCKVDAPPVASQFGWNGVVGVASWERESGIVRPLLYDDHEVLLLEMLVRSAYILNPTAHRHIRFLGAQLVRRSRDWPSVARSQVDQANLIANHGSSGGRTQSTAGRAHLQHLHHNVSDDSEHCGSPSNVSGLHRLASTGICSSNQDMVQRSHASSSAMGIHANHLEEHWVLGSDSDEDCCINLYVSLQGGQSVMCVLVDTSTWKVIETIYQPSGVLRDRWVYIDWFCWQDQLWHPQSVQHWSRGQAVQVLHIEVAERKSVSGAAPFDMREFRSRPSGTHFLASFDACLATKITARGHVLVRPVVNKKHIGWMLIDSGMSGMSLDGDAAEQLKLKAHGKIKVQTMNETIDSCLFQVKRFELGTLVMHGCVFMKLPLNLASAIEVPPDIKLAGMIGYDVLARALLVIPAAADITGKLTNLSRHSVMLAGLPLRPLPLESNLEWHPLMMICRLPHVHVNVTTAEGTEHSLMLMVDTGLVGAAVILSAKAATRLRLAVRSAGSGTNIVPSLVGIGETHVDMIRCSLYNIEICGHNLGNIDVLFSTSVSALNTASASADGFVGMDLLGRFDVWLDVMHERIALTS
eukprot:jgi/Ulvmu1/5903/UM026_0024.1